MKFIYERLILISFLFIGSFSAFADFPSEPGEDTWLNRPNDPLYENQWHLFSHFPPHFDESVLLGNEPFASGISVDKAWQYTRGSRKTLIALFDSGIEWNIDTEDLVDQYYLNKAELPLPEGSERYDKNGDGFFSASDYKNDSRVKDSNKNKFIDPQDLIIAFSDGVDDDHNGYVDDISGWDMHEGDNDPYDSLEFMHGTDQTRGIVAGINNGVGGAGVCGECSLIMIRISDSFLVDTNSFAKGIYYSVDLGADLISQALGGSHYSERTYEALNYAYDKGVLVIGTAADENSYHHNYPSVLDPIIYTNAVRHDSLNYKDAHSFVAHNNCSNYGARVDVATTGYECSSEATRNLSGVAGLAISYANELGLGLTPGELTALIKQTATDVNLGSNAEDASRYSTWKGWDTMTGYGRTNAGKMLEAIDKKRIPPESRIIEPRWFETISITSGEKIPVSIHVALPRSGKMKISLEVTRGVETSSSTWHPLKESSILEKPFKGQFAVVDPARLVGYEKNEKDKYYNEEAYTFRLIVDNLDGLKSEARRTVYIVEDPSLYEGFPKKLNASGDSGGLFVDLDADGRDEYVTADGSGLIHAFTWNSTELSGFPARGAVSRFDISKRYKTAKTYGVIFSSIAAGDIDDDGFNDIVAVTFEGQILAIDHRGLMKKGFPVTLPFPDFTKVSKENVFSYGSLSTPVLVDIDKDGLLEIVVTGLDGKLHVYTSEGSVQRGFPVALVYHGRGAKSVSSPAVYDLNKDGVVDFVLGSNHVGAEAGAVFAINGLGNTAESVYLKGFPRKIPVLKDQIFPTMGTGIPTSPSIGDIDGDGVVEIMIHPFLGKTFIIGVDGGLKRSLSSRVSKSHNTNDHFMYSGFGNPSLGDVNGDGVLDPVNLGAGKKIITNSILGGVKYDYDHMVGAWDGKTGKMLQGFPKKNDDMQIAPSASMVDLNQDGKEDVVVSSGGYFLHAFTEDGEIDDFPHFTGGWVYGAASFGDMDGDGLLEVAVSTREGYVFIWKTEAPVNSKKSWPTFKGNNRRTGVVADVGVN